MLGSRGILIILAIQGQFRNIFKTVLSGQLYFKILKENLNKRNLLNIIFESEYLPSWVILGCFQIYFHISYFPYSKNKRERNYIFQLLLLPSTQNLPLLSLHLKLLCINLQKELTHPHLETLIWPPSVETGTPTCSSTTGIISHNNDRQQCQVIPAKTSTQHLLLRRSIPAYQTDVKPQRHRAANPLLR